MDNSTNMGLTLMFRIRMQRLSLTKKKKEFAYWSRVLCGCSGYVFPAEFELECESVWKQRVYWYTFLHFCTYECEPAFRLISTTLSTFLNCLILSFLFAFAQAKALEEYRKRRPLQKH